MKKERLGTQVKLVEHARVKNNDRVEIRCNGKKIGSFVCIDNCCKAVHHLTDGIYEEPLNIGIDRFVAVNEFADIITRITISAKKPMKPHYVSRLVSIKSRSADLDKLRSVFRWQPKMSYEEGLEKKYCRISQIMAAKMYG
jgi:nucleoside-diphosphate-sugar epimerase